MKILDSACGSGHGVCSKKTLIQALKNFNEKNRHPFVCIPHKFILVAMLLVFAAVVFILVNFFIVD